ncbi:MAG: magnesium-translocating P-type ATPase [Acidaminococcaceae bacterium]|nr:magnesium-translocating P-type ATPase [Acidaminococcaceae bacterium]
MKNLMKNNFKTRLFWAAGCTSDEVLKELGTASTGLSTAAVEAAQHKYGGNYIAHRQSETIGKRLVNAFVNPFTGILVLLAGVSLLTDVIFAAEADRNYLTVLIITTMVLLSGILRLVQETKSGNAAAQLAQMIHTTTCVERIGTGKQEIDIASVVVGDIIHLSAGDMVPADVRIIAVRDLFVNQAALTGESEPIEKSAETYAIAGALTAVPNLAFMGTTVISGCAVAVVVAVGQDTLLGSLAQEMDTKPATTNFEKGVNAVSWVLIRFMLVMVPIVFIVNGYTKNNWLEAALFAISVAVGLTPEMLPMIVTTALARGATAMSKKKVIVKNLNAIQNLGSADILCSDKTGTLTQNKVVLEYHLDIHGHEDARVLRHGFLNSYYQTGLKNLLDIAIITYQEQLGSEAIKRDYSKEDELPFDFDRRRMSVVVRNKKGETQLITKGAVEEMLTCCSYVEDQGLVRPLSHEMQDLVLAQANELNEQGMRVIAVAHKANPAPVGELTVADETGMVLLGFLAFLDPPKASAAEAIKALEKIGVSIKILTGDNEMVTISVCRQVGIGTTNVMLGDDMDNMTDAEIASQTERTTIFAKLSPQQKARVVRLLRAQGHVVGFMGDGINDAAAMRAADVGISVDTAVDIAKESADIILLKKDLMVLEDGVVEGRKTYANMIKYIKMTVSSNFGNMFSVLVASAFLPFLPMAAIQIILLNLVYDLSCTAIPWDNVDEEYLTKPRKWVAASISKFMLWLGPVSSVFDITTYLFMYFVLCPAVTGGLLYSQLTDTSLQALYVAIFQTGWFIESMWSQTLVIHMIRTPQIPFIQSRAAWPVVLLTLVGCCLITAIPFTTVGAALGLTALPGNYFLWLLLTIIGYMLLTTLVKHRYVRRYGELL